MSSMTLGNTESDRPLKAGASFSRQLHQSRRVIMIDGGGARANEGWKTFSRGLGSRCEINGGAGKPGRVKERRIAFNATKLLAH